MSNTHRVVAVVFDYWLRERKPITAKALAQALGVTPGTAARWAYGVFKAEGWTRITITEVYVERESKSYPGLVDHHPVRAQAWAPTLDFLGDIIEGKAARPVVPEVTPS